MKKRIIVVLLCALQGCIPWRTTEQPGLQLEVKSTDGTSVPNAQVHFKKVKLVLLPKIETFDLDTDGNGHLQMDKKSDWYMASPVPDGMYSYEWFMCIEKEGYHPVARNQLSETKLPMPLIITLQSAQIGERCVWNEHYPFGFTIEPQHGS